MNSTLVRSIMSENGSSVLEYFNNTYELVHLDELI